ncbi:MAG: carbon-nitrogen family hydrolase [Ruminococcaceae bacterium]|nr:carbon-nitrogen family hydrolase [Oscillospiraceae bacterium]
MKVSCIQMDIALGRVDANFEKAKQLIIEAMKNAPDVIVLPETWNTGFFPKENLESYSDVNGQRTKAEIGGLAKEYNVNIVAGSVSNVKNHKVYNTAYVFDRQGECIAEYDKVHSFSPMGENSFYENGNADCRFTLDGKNCGIIICYDIRFPELTRKMAVNGLDCLFVVAQWPKVRVPHLTALVKARAIENQMFVVCCNSCGKAGETVYGGNSRIVEPWGNELVTADEQEKIITSELDFGVIKNIRETINVFRDRRPEIYDINN